jgi:branched-chain amino acid transport system permease protein
VLGAGIIVVLEDYLATAGIDAVGIVTGAIFVITVLLFRRGIWGTAQRLLRARGRRRHRGGPVPDEEPATPTPERVADPS